MDYLLTLDMGTTSLKSCLFDQKLNVVADITKEYKLSTPVKNIVEMDAESYWCIVIEAVQKLVTKSKVKTKNIISITCTTQGETLIPIGKDGNPLGPAIVWIDARAEEEATFFAEKIGHDLFYQRTGIPKIGPENPICKLKWYKDKMPDLYSNTYKFLLLEDFLVFKLTGNCLTNSSLIGTTGYFDINQNLLFDEVFDIINLDRNKIPEVKSSGEIIGNISASAAWELGLSQNTVVVSGAIDQVCTAIGSGNIKPGIISEVTGTCLVIAATTNKPIYDLKKRITYLKHYNNQYLILPYCTTAGIVLKWFKDNFCDKETLKQNRDEVLTYDQLTGLAAAIPAGSDGVVLLPHFAGKMSPIVNTDATGVLYGIGLQTTKGHIVRAILEAVAYMLRENLEFIESTGLQISQIRSVGGGSKSELWNQIKADVCKKDILTFCHSEAASLGAAVLGAKACGYYDNVTDGCNQIVMIKAHFRPRMENSIVYDKTYEIYSSLYENVESIFAQSKILSNIK